MRTGSLAGSEEGSTMKQSWTVASIVIALLGYRTPALAQAPTAAEKAAAASSAAVDFGPFAAAAFNSSTFITTPFQDVLQTTIKPPGGKDLFINVSMETGIFTTTDLQNQAGFGLTLAQPDTQLQVRVVIDCPDCPQPYTERPAEPATVNFDNVFRSVLHVSTSGFDAQNEIKDQLGVRSFSFVARDVGVGIHTIRVQARFTTASSALSINGFAFSSVQARIGTRTATVEEIKLDAP
jgi:hypothetical protein